LRVRTVENKAPAFKQILIRNILRIPDYYLFIVMLFSMRAQRLGDRLARTVVVLDAKLIDTDI